MIIQNNEAALRIKCSDASIEEAKEIIALLDRELENSGRLGFPGIGLAAPQIGISKNVAIVRLDSTNKIDLVNCDIQNTYDKQMFRDEGCLSFPGRVEHTMRHRELHVINNLVYPHSFIASGLLAVVCEHELEHLKGILFFDQITNISDKKQIKLGRNDICYCNSGLKFKRCHGK